jgi:hypothetical protein
MSSGGGQGPGRPGHGALWRGIGVAGRVAGHAHAGPGARHGNDKGAASRADICPGYRDADGYGGPPQAPVAAQELGTVASRRFRQARDRDDVSGAVAAP